MYSIIVGYRFIHVAGFSLVGVAVAECRHHSPTVVEESVAVGKSCSQVRQRLFAFYAQISHAEVCLIGRVGIAVYLIGAVLGNAAMVKTLEVEIHKVCVVARLQVYTQQALRRCILHHHVHCASDAVALHVGGKGFGHLQPVEQLRGEDVQWHKTVFAIRAGNFHAVDQSVVVSFVHTTQNGILSFARRVALHGHTAHALYHVGHCKVWRQFYGLGTHDVDHIHGIAFQLPCADFRTSFVFGHHHHFAQGDIVSFQIDAQVVVIVVHLHLYGLVAQVAAHQRTGKMLLVELETPIESCGCALVGSAFDDDRCTDDFFTRYPVDDFSLDDAGLYAGNGQQKA